MSVAAVNTIRDRPSAASPSGSPFSDAFAILLINPGRGLAPALCKVEGEVVAELLTGLGGIGRWRHFSDDAALEAFLDLNQPLRGRPAEVPSARRS